MPEREILRVENLSKRFRRKDAVKELSFSLAPGRVLGFLGPDGSGKTTTLRMVLGLLRPTAGSALIDGVSYAQLRRPARVVGSAFEHLAFAPGRTARKHLWARAPSAGADARRVDEVLELVGIHEEADRPVRQLSPGMRRRLALGAALLGRPRMLVLDEPASGLDPGGMTWLRNTITQMSEAGVAVLVSSRLLAELDQVVQDVVLLDRAQAVFSGTRSELVDGRSVLSVVESPRGRALLEIIAERVALLPLPDGRFWAEERQGQVERMLREHGADYGEAEVAPADLESAFKIRTFATPPACPSAPPRSMRTNGG